MIDAFDKSFWENRWIENQTGWDIGNISTPIKTYFETLEDKNIKILIPGCGNAWEATWLFEMGFSNVFIADIAELPLLNFEKLNPLFPKKQILHINFFEIKDKFDIIIEQTFFCAINPDLREQYVKKSHSLLNDNGLLIGLLFNDPKLTLETPPFRCLKEEYTKLFSSNFEIEILENCTNSIKPRAGRELFFKFRKK